MYLCFKKIKDNDDVTVSSNDDSFYLPKVTIQIPLFNERYVVDRIIDSVVKIDYPEDKIEIQILDDSSDITTELAHEKVEHYAKKGINIKLIHRVQRTGFKAGALNNGLKSAEGELFAIFDADFIPEKDFLKRTVFYFRDEKIGALQTRWGHLNKDYSMLTKFQATFLDLHFKIEKVGLSKGKLFNKFNGTSGIWRKSCIEDAGGWQSDTLIEDVDLSYRAQLKGWEVKYLEHVVTPAELPIDMTALRSQLFRWMKGIIQNTKKNLVSIIKAPLSLSTKIHVFFNMLECWQFVFIFIMSLLSVPVLFYASLYPATINICFILLILIVIIYSLFDYAAVRKEMGSTLKSICIQNINSFVTSIMMLGLSLNISFAVFEGLIGKVTPFVRTPKFNVAERTGMSKSNVYIQKKFEPIILLEFLFSLYFAFGIYLDFVFKQYSFVLIHLIFCSGYIAVVFFSIKSLMQNSILSLSKK